tara:strand:+ start:1675 stop:3426 length:1752 start_codon:yes stop_codon:yes gene_type:complete
MVFYLGAALGKIGEAIQADTSERRAIRIRAEEREEDRTNLIMKTALDLGTQDYYKRKQAAELKKSAIEEHMSQLALTGLDVDERFRIAQGGEGAVKDVMDRFVRWEGTFGDNSDTNLSFGDFYDIKKASDDFGRIRGQDYSALSDSEFLDLFMPNKVTFDSDMITNYLAQYDMSPTETMLDAFSKYDQTETDKAIPTLGAITIREDALKEALNNPEKAKAYSGFEAAIVDTQTKINDLNIEIENATTPEEIESLNAKLKIQKQNMENYKLLQPTKGKGIAEVLGETSSQLAIEKSKDVSEQDKKLITQLENKRDYLLSEKALIEAAGKTTPLNDVVANTTYQIDKLSRLEQTPDIVAKIETLKITQNRALEGIQAIQEAKEKAKEKYKEPEAVKSNFTNTGSAQSFLARFVSGKLSDDYAIFNTKTEQIALKFGKDKKALQNYSHYFDAHENVILPALRDMINKETLPNGKKNVYYQDENLTPVVEAHIEDFEFKLKKYYVDFEKRTDLVDVNKRAKHIKTFKLDGVDREFFNTEEEVQKAANEGIIKTGDFIYLTNDKIPVVWSGKNAYYLYSDGTIKPYVF